MPSESVATGRFGHRRDRRRISAIRGDLAGRRISDQSGAGELAGVPRLSPTPAHYHATCDEYLYVFSGRGTFWMKDPATEAEFKPGQLLFFERGTVHAMPKLFDHPVVFLSIDTPRRDPMDIIFVGQKEGTPQSFMARNATTE